MAVTLTFSLSLYPSFWHVQWHTSRWKSGDRVELAFSPWQLLNLSNRSRLSLKLVRTEAGKAQLSGVQKMDPFLVKRSVVSTFGQVPEGRIACFSDNGELT